MTIKEARKILGKDAHGVSDADILEDIETAEMFENMFFNMITREGYKTLKTSG